MGDGALGGKLLIAAPMLTGPPFERTVIAVLEHSAAGALGVVVNRPRDSPLGAVVPAVAEIASQPPVLFDGGPVEPQAAIALGLVHTGPSAPQPSAEQWRPLHPPLVSVDLDAEPAVLAGAMRELRVFTGYAGWSPGQLEREIADGAWYVVESLPSDAFVARPELLWGQVLRRQPWPLSAVATFPTDPRMN